MPLPILDKETDDKYANLTIVERDEVEAGSARFPKYGLGCVETGRSCTRAGEATISGDMVLKIRLQRFSTCTQCEEHGIDNP